MDRTVIFIINMLFAITGAAMAQDEYTNIYPIDQNQGSYETYNFNSDSWTRGQYTINNTDNQPNSYVDQYINLQNQNTPYQPVSPDVKEFTDRIHNLYGDKTWEEK